MQLNFDQERFLEQKYKGVLAYTTAKEFLRETPYTTGKMNGAIKRFINAEGATKPKNFTEMEVFSSDLVDFYLDSTPDDHEQGEFVLNQSVSNYVAFSHVWKIKARTSTVLDPELIGTVGHWLTARKALASMSMVLPSMAKRANGHNKELYSNLIKDLPQIYQILYATGANIVKGILELPETESQQDISRMIGAYYAGNKNILEAANALKQIEGVA